MSSNSKLWLIGTGPMAQAYALALRAQGISFSVIGRSPQSSETFLNLTGIPVVSGGLESALALYDAPDKAIVAVGIHDLVNVAKCLLSRGCLRILLEKPGALFHCDLLAIEKQAYACKAQIWIAYNRRFYSSVLHVKKLVEEEGGIVSANFEFTEWSHEISSLVKPKNVKSRWLLANSSHVLDLAFYLIGLPSEDEWNYWSGGALDWHPSSARFNGAGLSVKGIPFTYQADWEAPGRWGLEVLTRYNRYILRPMETLQKIPTASVTTMSVPLDDSLDKEHKPGLYLQCKAFLENDHTTLCSLEDQIKAFLIYTKIAGYSA